MDKLKKKLSQLPVETRSALRIDVTEHLTHVRMVHFALLALCFILLAAILLNRDTEVTRAIAQLTTVNDGLQRWNPAWLQDLLLQTNSVGTPSETGASDGPWLLKDTEGRPSISIERPTSERTLWPLPKQLEDLTKPLKSPDWRWDMKPALKKQPTNLGEFKTLWSALDTRIAVHQIESVGNVAAVFALAQLEEVPGTREIVPLTQAPVDSAACRMAPNLTYMQKHEGMPEVIAVKSTAPFVHLLHGYCSDCYASASHRCWSISIEVGITDVQSFNGQSTFLKAHEITAPLGPYEMAFPELARIAANYDDLNFKELFAVLEAEKVRFADQIELFGAKLPGDILALWGLPLLCVVQLYLMLHLEALRESVRVSPAEGFVSWIGVYSSRSAHATTIASASILPLLTAFLLRYIDASPSKWASGSMALGLTLSLAISFGLAALTWRAVWRVRDAAARCTESGIGLIGGQPAKGSGSGAISKRPAPDADSSVPVTTPTPPSADSVAEIRADAKNRPDP